MIRIEGTLGQSQERRAHVISSYDIINETKFRANNLLLIGVNFA